VRFCRFPIARRVVLVADGQGAADRQRNSEQRTILRILSDRQSVVKQ
jgi:hypothetical protein